MPEDGHEIAYCHACGTPMDVTAVAPFSNVECPTCKKHTRVKREFGPYTLTRRLAIGGMSLVFVGHDNALDREVAVKILNEEFSIDEKRIPAFEEEARITALISHPNVVRVFTTGRAFDRYYIAMELVPGGHLENQIHERGMVPEAEALTLAIEVAEGLKAAQAAGLIHRDIKPGNILIDAEGHAKIVDFGLALMTKGGKATAGEIWATPYYVPPEAIEGKEEDFRSDLYAFGATFYHALAGRPPCKEESMVTTVLREAKKHIPPLDSVASWLSLETCAVIDRAMSYDAAARFDSYDEMLAALRNALQRLGHEGGPAVKSSRELRKDKQKRERMMAVATAGVVLATGGGGWLLWKLSNRSMSAPPPQMVVAVPHQDPGADKASKASQHVISLYQEAHAALMAKEFAQAQKQFAELRDDAQVQQPTGTWAAVQAVVAAYLDGRAADARAEAKTSIGRLKPLDVEDKHLKDEVLSAFERIEAMPSVPVESSGSEIHGASEVMRWMMFGLKNWEQGKLDDAAQFFEAVRSAHLDGQDSWVSAYQDLAAAYLDDRKLMRDSAPPPVLADKKQCAALIAQCDEVLANLKTRGRARFNVFCWKLDAARRSHQLDHPPEPVPADATGNQPSFEEAVSGLAGLWSACEFAEGAKRLKNLHPAAAKQQIKQAALLTLTEAASAFLGDLEEDLAKGTVVVPMHSRDGKTEFSNVSAGSSAGHVKLAGAGGSVMELSWKDLAPESVIELHRQVVRNVPNDVDRLRRHEAAIAYDWLCGDRTRAQSAAERLAADNASFKARWESIRNGLGE